MIHENLAPMRNSNFATKSFDFESRVEPIMRSVPSPVLIVPPAVPGGVATKMKANAPLKSKSVVALMAVAGNWTKPKKKKFKEPSVINARTN